MIHTSRFQFASKATIILVLACGAAPANAKDLALLQNRDCVDTPLRSADAKLKAHLVTLGGKLKAQETYYELMLPALNEAEVGDTVAKIGLTIPAVAVVAYGAGAALGAISIGTEAVLSLGLSMPSSSAAASALVAANASYKAVGVTVLATATEGAILTGQQENRFSTVEKKIDEEMLDVKEITQFFDDQLQELENRSDFRNLFAADDYAALKVGRAASLISYYKGAFESVSQELKDLQMECRKYGFNGRE